MAILSDTESEMLRHFTFSGDPHSLFVGGYMEQLDGKWILVKDTKCPEKDTSPATLGLTNMAGKQCFQCLKKEENSVLRNVAPVHHF